MNALAMVRWAFVLLFTGLKLSNNIDWSWWWVFSPIWVYGLLMLTGLSLRGIYRAFFESPNDRLTRESRQLVKEMRSGRR